MRRFTYKGKYNPINAHKYVGKIENVTYCLFDNSVLNYTYTHRCAPVIHSTAHKIWRACTACVV